MTHTPEYWLKEYWSWKEKEDALIAILRAKGIKIGDIKGYRGKVRKINIQTLEFMLEEKKKEIDYIIKKQELLKKREEEIQVEITDLEFAIENHKKNGVP